MAIAVVSTTKNTATTGTTLSVTGLTQSAGADRLVMFTWAAETTTTLLTSLTYDGVDVLSLGEHAAGFWLDSAADLAVDCYILKGTDLPADGGSKTATAGWSGSTAGASLGVTYLTGCSQGSVSGAVATGAADATNPRAFNVTSPASTAAIVSVCGSGNSGTVTQNRTLLWESESLNATTAHSAQIQINAPAGAQSQSFTFGTTPNRTAWLGFAIAEAPAVRNVSGGFTLGAVTVAGNVVATDRNVSGGITTSPVTVDGDGDIMARVLGAIVIDNVDVSASLELIAHISGGILLGPVTVAGVVEPARLISGNIQIGVVEVAGLILPTRVISGDILLGAVTMAGNLATEDTRNISGAILLSAVEVSGELEPARVISGNVQLGAVTVTGAVGVEVSLDGAIVLTPPTVAGALQLFLSGSGAIVLGPVGVSGVLSQLTIVSGAILLGAVEVSGRVRTQFPGSVLVSDAPSGTVEIEDGPAGGALAVDAESGSVTIGDQAI
jgi:hypothetical protein